ncbi:DNA binding HTH domain Psq-type [Penicillium hetheringtonii]|uniref:DNA binding HTH domain Psq-type n=1 Tax=Penicillium hetheringtonii TaxID=911720 RepID=A0AAD6DZ06_9EURO|nr:DNA binding HTH domain Psq-type [Penicillium hetheringtonii]
MPPIRSESSHKPANQEGRALWRLMILNMAVSNPFAQQRIYTKYRVQHYKRALTAESHRSTGHKLIQFEKDSLTGWIISMDVYRAAPRPAIVRDMANILLAVCGNNPPATVDKNWLSIFIQRRDELYPKSLQEWFSIDENKIQAENIHNFDKTEFAIDFISMQKSENCEWITAIEVICTDSFSLLFCIVFKSKIAIAD